MQTPREAMLALYSGKTADFIPSELHCFKDIAFPGDRFILPNNLFEPYGTGPDAWGVLWTNLGPNPSLDGSMVAQNFTLFDCVEDWEHFVHFPDPEAEHFADILQNTANSMNIDPERDVISVLLLSGQFERLNEMVGMEEALCSFYEYPDELHAFFDAMCDYKLRCIQIAFDTLHPDIIHMHDDWGTANNLFFSSDLWHEFILPNERRYAEKIHQLGMFYEHHSCGYIQPLIPYFVEIGIDCINPLNICNDLTQIQHQFGGQITLKGGVNNLMLDSGHATEEEIRAEARRVIDAYAPTGRYIPSYVATRADVQSIFFDEIQRYGVDFYRH